MVEVLAVALFLAAQASDVDPESRLAAAIHTEMVEGDLKRAVEQYTAILARSPANRPIAAQALSHLAECQEKAGQREAAHAAYLRLARDFGDQAELAARAREKLAAWTRAQQGPRNLNFEHGESGWIREPGASLQVRHEGCRSVPGCVQLGGPGRVTQSFAADSYRGKAVRFRAWLRGDRAQIWLGDDHVDAVESARWVQCEIAGEIPANAPSIRIGVLSPGSGRVWIDAISFQVIPESEINATHAAIQKVYEHMDSAYLQPDLDGFADVAAADAQYRDTELAEPLRKAVERWKVVAQNGTELAHHTAITALQLSGGGVVVTARVEYARSEANRTRSVSYVDTRRDTWVRVGASWQLKEYRLLTTRQVDSTTDVQTARRAAADLKRTAAPLATLEVGHTFYDLAPFGMAVGAARIVALGEATFGVREFFQIKHRLLEFLVKEKGFTIFAIDANFLDANKLDNYVRAGEGDPRGLLSGMLWPWNMEEARDVVEWMREFNAEPGDHPILRFASFGIPPASLVIPRVVDYLQQCSPLDAVTAQTEYSALLEMESRIGDVYDDAATRAADKAEHVVRLLDEKHDSLIRPTPVGACSATAWRDARQAAEEARQNAATHISGKGSAYGNEMKARNVEWLANDAYPGEKIVLWGHNALVGYASNDSAKSVGTWLRDEYREQIYVTGFACYRGELLAPGFRNGNYEGVARQRILEPQEASGDSVLSAAGMPVFFLDLRSLPATSALGRWIAESHSFLEVSAWWNRDDPQSNSRVRTLAKSYDGLIFLDEAHPAHGL
jgi:erythromycin esterase